MNDKSGVVTISAPQAEAKKLASLLVEKRAAACVQILPHIESVYWWKGAVQSEDEALLVAKTLKSKLDDIKALLKEHHPYELPELVFLPITDGLADYITWIQESVSAG